MSISDATIKKVMDCKQRFVCVYAKRYVSGYDVESAKEAIKKFNSCHSVSCSYVWDSKEEKMYYSVGNEEPDVRGNYNYSYKDKDENVIYNEDEDTRPLIKLTPDKLEPKTRDGYISPSGDFYKCGFQCHRFLAKELFITSTITPKKNEDMEPSSAYDFDRYLDNRGWMKITNGRIHHRKSYADLNLRERTTAAQRRKIIEFLKTSENENFEYNHSKRTKEELIEFFKQK